MKEPEAKIEEILEEIKECRRFLGHLNMKMLKVLRDKEKEAWRKDEPGRDT